MKQANGFVTQYPGVFNNGVQNFNGKAIGQKRLSNGGGGTYGEALQEHNMNTDMGWRPKFAATSDNFYKEESSSTRKPSYPEKNMRFHSNRRIGEQDHSLSRVNANTLYGSPNHGGLKGMASGRKTFYAGDKQQLKQQ